MPTTSPSSGNDGIDLTKYRAVVAGDVVRQKLEDKIVADATEPAPQRHVAENLHPRLRRCRERGRDRGRPSRSATSSTRRRTTRRARPTSPTRSRRGRSPRPTPRPTYAKLQARPELFDSIARKPTATRPARPAPGHGRQAPVLRQGQPDRHGVPRRHHEDRREGGRPAPTGQVRLRLARHPGDVRADRTRTQLARSRPRPTPVRTSGRSPATSPKPRMPAPVATSAGSPRASSTNSLTDSSIFAAEVGKTSAVVTVPDDGIYLFKVFEEETRTPEGRTARRRSRRRPSTPGTRPRRTRPPSRVTRPSPGRPARQEVRCSTRSSPRPGCDGGWIRLTASR